MIEKVLYLLNNIEIRNIIDIILFSGFIFLINLIIVRTRAFKLIIGIIILIILSLMADWFNLIITKMLIQTILPFSFIILALIFQKEIKIFLEQFIAIIPRKRIHKNKQEKIIDSILTAIRYFSQEKIGAIIVLEKNNNLDSLIEGGKLLNSEINPEIIISIFLKNTPLHDGAMVIKNDKIKYASVHLPLAEDYKFNIKAGTRHRAGLGITQISDAVSIIISEENGNISIAKNGELYYNVSEKEVLKELKDYYKPSLKNKNFFINLIKNFSQYAIILTLSILVSSSFWIYTNYNKFKIQKIIEVPIEFINLKENLAIINPSTDKVKVSLSGYDYDLKTLNISQIKVIVDLSDAEEGRYTIDITKDNLTNLRSNIEVIQINPEIIKFRIIQKETLQKINN